MLLVAAIPVLAVGALTVGSLFGLADRSDQRLEASEAELRSDTIGANRADRSRLALDRVDAYVDERIADVIEWSATDRISDAARADYPQVDETVNLSPATIDSRFGADFQLDGSGRVRQWLRSRVGADSAFIDALVTDANGFTVGSAETPTDFTNADSEWWQRAWDDGVYLGPVTALGTGPATFDIAVRIDDPTTRDPLGVVVGRVALSALHPIADEYATEGDEIEVRLLSDDGQILAETASDHDPTTILGRSTLGTDGGRAYAAIVDDGRTAGFVFADDFLIGFSRSDERRMVPVRDIEIDTPPMIAVVEQPSAIALAPLDGLDSLSTDLNTTARVLTVTIAGLVVAALAMALLLARLLARRIARPINALRDEAHRLADRELPELVTALRSPEAGSEIPEVAPVEIDADGEVAELASAFNSVRSTAVQLAASQAIERTRDVSSILVNLGRRNQHLVGRQLRFIDELERAESDPDTLRNLFVLDQMATRMRRNAESLLVLAGEESPRRTASPRPVIEVVRAAVGEVEDFTRISLGSIDLVMIQPRVVNDLSHLLAELIENATNFSPPEEPVHLIGARTDTGGYTLSIIDRGVGMTRDSLREANHRIGNASRGGDSTSSYLGLRVVGRLAARHGIDARLVESATMGVTAKVTLPPALIAGIPEPVTPTPTGPRQPPSSLDALTDHDEADPSGSGRSAPAPDTTPAPSPNLTSEPRRPAPPWLAPSGSPTSTEGSVDDAGELERADAEATIGVEAEAEAEATIGDPAPGDPTSPDSAAGPSASGGDDLALNLFEDAIERASIDDHPADDHPADDELADERSDADADADAGPAGEPTDDEGPGDRADLADLADLATAGSDPAVEPLPDGPAETTLARSMPAATSVPDDNDRQDPTESQDAVATVASREDAPVAAAAGRPVIIEDERSGVPIPPFKARVSKRSPGDGDRTGTSLPTAPSGTEGMMQVEPRIRPPRDPNQPSAPLMVASGPEARADEVREKLNRFASGVRAARRRTGRTAAVPSVAETDEPGPSTEPPTVDEPVDPDLDSPPADDAATADTPPPTDGATTADPPTTTDAPSPTDGPLADTGPRADDGEPPQAPGAADQPTDSTATESSPPARRGLRRRLMRGKGHRS